MSFEIVSDTNKLVKIKVVGVGGGGGNAVERMVENKVGDVEFITINTDKQVLDSCNSDKTIQIGEKLTKGRGAGAIPEIGAKAAEENREEIEEVLEDTDMVFITAGMGGGTGTGAAPIVAEIAKQKGALTVGIVTKPFSFEGKKRMEQAEAGIANLSQHVDSLIIIPNERLKYVSEEKITLKNAFEKADDVLRDGVMSISRLIKIKGLVNVDFADVDTIMKDAGLAHMGVGVGRGKDKAVEAAKAAISSPLLETSINGAKGVLVNVTVPEDIELDEVSIASDMIAEAAHPEARIIWSAFFDNTLEDEMQITVIAAGFDDDNVTKVKAETSVDDVKEALNNADDTYDTDLDPLMKILSSRGN